METMHAEIVPLANNFVKRTSLSPTSFQLLLHHHAVQPSIGFKNLFPQIRQRK
jgi:hypothetical protein